MIAEPQGDALRLFAINPGRDFASDFVHGLKKRLSDQPPELLAKTEIFVPSRRAARAIEDAFRQATEIATFLPQLTPISELTDHPAVSAMLPLAVSTLRRKLHLTRLVTAYLNAAPNRPPVFAAPALAESLAGLLDELQEEGIAPAELDTLAQIGGITAESARHWQETLSFVDLIRNIWPAVLREMEEGRIDSGEQQVRAVEALSAHWAEHPPRAPVIVAGSTGSRRPTAELMATVARLENGAVILPGFDPKVEGEIWNRAGPEHPMGSFKRSFQRIRAAPKDVRPWRPAGDPSPRLKLLTQALRPAPVTDAWSRLAPDLLAGLEDALQGLTLIEASHQRAEAAAIALALRQAIENPDSRVALVTPDATLTRRVKAELDRYQIEPDDSLGRPLTQSPAGVFMRSMANIARPTKDPVRLTALLQHPFTRAGRSRREHLRTARRYELAVLRAGISAVSDSQLLNWPDAAPEDADWLSSINTAIAPLEEAIRSGGLRTILLAHRSACEALAAGPDGDPGALWSGPDGAQLYDHVEKLIAAADAYGLSTPPNYPHLFENLLSSETVRADPVRPHPRVMIWGTLEARIQSADLIVLAGLNEGVWPSLPGADPWLSRPMREALGLAQPERSVGLSAHDFFQAAAQPNVILTRSRKVDGTPQVASRWLKRLENLISGIGNTQAHTCGGKGLLDAARSRGNLLLQGVETLHRPEKPVPPAKRPAPMPPASARPRRLSVTQVETLIRDPYAVYARHILRLAPLDPLGRTPSYLERGQVIHAVLEEFIKQTCNEVFPPSETARALLMHTADVVLKRDIPWPDIRRVWRGRIARFADWFVQSEAERRRKARPIALEVKGRLTLIPDGEPFELRARADRIDLVEGNGAAIYDYKTGDPPSEKQIGTFSHQLHLQAAILMQGGFEGLDALQPRHGAYIGLTGAKEGGRETRAADLVGELEDHLSKVTELLSLYGRETTGYLAQARPQKTADAGDYDHLARRAEWEGTDGI